MYWVVSGDIIEIALQGSTTGTVAIGFIPPSKDLTQADMIVGWVNSKGQTHVYDFYNHDQAAIYEDDADGGANDIIAYAGYAYIFIWHNSLIIN